MTCLRVMVSLQHIVDHCPRQKRFSNNFLVRIQFVICYVILARLILNLEKKKGIFNDHLIAVVQALYTVCTSTEPHVMFTSSEEPILPIVSKQRFVSGNTTDCKYQTGHLWLSQSPFTLEILCAINLMYFLFFNHQQKYSF